MHFESSGRRGVATSLVLLALAGCAAPRIVVTDAGGKTLFDVEKPVDDAVFDVTFQPRDGYSNCPVAEAAQVNHNCQDSNRKFTCVYVNKGKPGKRAKVTFSAGKGGPKFWVYFQPFDKKPQESDGNGDVVFDLPDFPGRTVPPGPHHPDAPPSTWKFFIYTDECVKSPLDPNIVIG